MRTIDAAADRRRRVDVSGTVGAIDRRLAPSSDPASGD
jgi:hypothetical protein